MLSDITRANREAVRDIENLHMDGSSWGERTDDLLEEVWAEGDNPDRQFTPAWARQWQGRLLGIDRYAREWTNSTALLSPTGMTTWPGSDDFMPPTVHFNRLQASKSARERALSRCLSDVKQWRAVRVLGPTETGYVAPHVAIYCSDPVSVSQFDPWVESHVANSPIASDSAHGSETVSIEADPSTRSETGVIGYAMVNVPGLDTRGEKVHGLVDANRARARTATVIDHVDCEPIRPGRDSV